MLKCMYKFPIYIRNDLEENIMKKMTKILALALALVMILSLCACGKKAPANELNLLTAGVLSVGLEPTYPPFEEVATDGVTLVGYDIDLAKALAAKLGVEVSFVNTSFDGIFAGMGKQYDVVISGVTITEERKGEMLFSTPYISNYQAIVAKKGSDITASSLSDLSGKSVSVQKGTTSDALLSELIDTGSITDVTNVSIETVVAALNMVSNGEVEVCLLDSTVANVYVSRDESLEIIYVDNQEPEEFGVAIEMTNTKLQEAINKAMTELEAEGFFTDCVATWFG